MKKSFFELLMGYDSLSNYYKSTFSLMQFHKWDITYIEGLMPWEKFLYLDMLQKYVQHENDVAREKAAARRKQIKNR